MTKEGLALEGASTSQSEAAVECNLPQPGRLEVHEGKVKGDWSCLLELGMRAQERGGGGNTKNKPR